MTNKIVVFLLILAVQFSTAYASEPLLKTQDIRIRDPFIYANQLNKTYYMYAQAANRSTSNFIGVEVYTSKDLINWQPPQPVLELPEDAGIKAVWAPEMHEYNGKFYLFVTLTYNDTLSVNKPVEKLNWPEMNIRGTHVFYADNPLGTFKRFKETSHTPENWMALDGTLYVEEGIPYMVFCHEWVQTIDGTMNYVELTKDLSDTKGESKLLFKASIAPGAKQSPAEGKVTDGCFIYKSPKSGKLFMTWATFTSGNGYSVVLTHSESGKISGPWKEQKLLYTQDGGHGMFFETFDGRLLMTLHQPNGGAKERLHLFQIVDDGETLDIEKEVYLK